MRSRLEQASKVTNEMIHSYGAWLLKNDLSYTSYTYTPIISSHQVHFPMTLNSAKMEYSLNQTTCASTRDVYNEEGFQ